MADRPIIMTGDSVRGILAGRKTQTRRVIKDEFLQSLPFENLSPIMNSPPHCHANGVWFYELQSEVDATEHIKIKCPYGVVGDRLWCKETFSFDHKEFYPNFPIVYKAEGYPEDWIIENGKIYSNEQKKWYPFRWKSPLFMFKKYARIWLEITGIRVERVQDISFDDCRAEGIDKWRSDDCINRVHCLWDSINAKRGYGWDKNVWVWVIEFRKAQDGRV